MLNSVNYIYQFSYSVIFPPRSLHYRIAYVHKAPIACMNMMQTTQHWFARNPIRLIITMHACILLI